jgi:hypothetical protein
MATTVKNQIDSIDRFLKAVGYSEKNAAANTEAGSIGGETTHPVKDVDDSTEDASEGARSAENTADVKADQGPASVENAKKAAARKRASANKWAAEKDPTGSASDDQLQIGTNKQPTGEDPSVETSSVKAEKDDVETSHPASTDNSELDGNKYASMSTAALHKLSNDLGNRVLVSLTKNAEFHDDDEDRRKSDSDSGSSSDSDMMEEKGAVDLAGQAGWELAGLLSGQFDKRAADSLVYSTLSEIIKTANDDADKAAVYLHSYQNELYKQAEGEEMPPEMDPSAGGMPPAGGGDEAAMAGAMGGGAAPEGEGGDDVEQLAAVLDQLGISPEELEAAMAGQGHEGGGHEGGGHDGGGAPPMGGGAPPEMANASPNMEVEAAYKQAAAKKGAANKNVRDYIQEVLERSRR